mgnify:CR=1 FL=1
MEESRKKQIWFVTGILLGVSVLVMYITHRHVPFMMDDLWYSTVLSDETVPIASLGDIVRSQIWHWQNWGGRSITHGILQLTLLGGEHLADLLNVGVTLLLAWVACVTAENRRLPAFFAALAMMLGLNANWKMSMFWQAGAANYPYITVVILLFAVCYLKELPDGGKETVHAARKGAKAGEMTADGKDRITGKGLPGITFWIIPLGLFAGWSNENMGPAVWILSLVVILCAVREKRRVPVWMMLGNLFCLLGSVMVIVAPGNFVRSAQAPDREYGLLWRLFLRGYAESRAALDYLFPTLLVLGIVVLVGKCALKISLGRRNLLLLFCALLSWGAMFLSPHYPDRAAFGTMMLLICVVLSMAAKIVRERKDMLLPLWGVSLLIWLRGMYFCGEFLAICWGWIR